MRKTSVVFVDPGAKINSAYYCKVVLLGKSLLPDIEAKCGRHKCTFQHDGTPAHTPCNTMEYLEKEKIDFVEPDMWDNVAPKQLGS